MIPPADVQLDATTRARWALTQHAAAVALLGVPADLVMLDARDGFDLAAQETTR